MPAMNDNSFQVRVAEPKVIEVTLVDIEAPIHSRPVLQSHESHSSPPSSMYPTATEHVESDRIGWGMLVLLILLAGFWAIAVRWSTMMEKFWKWTQGWKSAENDEEYTINIRGLNDEKNLENV